MRGYVLEAVGVPNWWWCGPSVGFTNIEESAIVYVSKEVARVAADIVFARCRKLAPKHRRLVVREFNSEETPNAKTLAAMRELVGLDKPFSLSARI